MLKGSWTRLLLNIVAELTRFVDHELLPKPAMQKSLAGALRAHQTELTAFQASQLSRQC